MLIFLQLRDTVDGNSVQQRRVLVTKQDNFAPNVCTSLNSKGCNIQSFLIYRGTVIFPCSRIKPIKSIKSSRCTNVCASCLFWNDALQTTCININAYAFSKSYTLPLHSSSNQLFKLPRLTVWIFHSNPRPNLTFCSVIIYLGP